MAIPLAGVRTPLWAATAVLKRQPCPYYFSFFLTMDDWTNWHITHGWTNWRTENPSSYSFWSFIHPVHPSVTALSSTSSHHSSTTWMEELWIRRRASSVLLLVKRRISSLQTKRLLSPLSLCSSTSSLRLLQICLTRYYRSGKSGPEIDHWQCGLTKNVIRRANKLAVKRDAFANQRIPVIICCGSANYDYCTGCAMIKRQPTGRNL